MSDAPVPPQPVPSPELVAALQAVLAELAAEQDPTRRSSLAQQAAVRVATCRDEAIREAASIHERLAMGKLAGLCGVTEATATWALANMRSGPRV